MKIDLKIVSGGQTGVDRAGLDAAIWLGVRYGGWVPRGRIAEDGHVPPKYDGMKEFPEGGYRARTKANVRDSDATLIVVANDPLSGGTKLTADTAREQGRPVFVMRLEEAGDYSACYRWLKSTLRKRHAVLNIAGPRESTCPGIYERALTFLRDVLMPYGHWSSKKIEEYERLQSEKAQVCRLASGLDVYVRTDEQGERPHFHVADAETLGCRFHTSLCIDKPEYYVHGEERYPQFERRHDKLTKAQVVELMSALKEVDPHLPVRTKRKCPMRWQALLVQWNMGRQSGSLNCRMPDYRKISDLPGLYLKEGQKRGKDAPHGKLAREQDRTKS